MLRRGPQCFLLFAGLPAEQVEELRAARAEYVLALRCIDSSRRLAGFWKDRLNAHAARDDSPALAA